MREIVALMTPEEFAKIKIYVEQKLSKLRAQNYDNNAMRCWLIGYLFDNADTDSHRVYTSKELGELFDLTFG